MVLGRFIIVAHHLLGIGLGSFTGFIPFIYVNSSHHFAKNSSTALFNASLWQLMRFSSSSELGVSKV
jgi:TctA family transporter